MNLYLRYFNEETLVHSVDEAVDFLSSIPTLHIDEAMVEDLHQFMNSNVSYPKRYKVRPRVYFIVIKTTAETMDEFKSYNKAEAGPMLPSTEENSPKENPVIPLQEERTGWYEGEIVFKRVIPVPGTGKYQYKDTRFVAQVKATSGQNCYERIVEHLKNRQDVDLRSQFPSARGRKFSFVFLGEQLPTV